MANMGLESRSTPPTCPLIGGISEEFPMPRRQQAKCEKKILTLFSSNPLGPPGRQGRGGPGTLRTLETRDGAHSPPCSSPALPFLQRELAMQRPFETPHRLFAAPPRRPGNPHRMPSARWFHESRPGWRRCATPFRY